LQNETAPGHRTSHRINAIGHADLEYWSRKFGVSKSTLANTIRRVGDSANDVQADIQEQKHRWRRHRMRLSAFGR
jgi:hypothetical protein